MNEKQILKQVKEKIDSQKFRNKYPVASKTIVTLFVLIFIGGIGVLADTIIRSGSESTFDDGIDLGNISVSGMINSSSIQDFSYEGLLFATNFESNNFYTSDTTDQKILFDSSLKSHDAKVINGSFVSSGGFNEGGYYKQDGVNDYISLPTSMERPIANGSVSVWFQDLNRADTSSAGRVLSIAVSQALFNGIMIRKDTTANNMLCGYGNSSVFRTVTVNVPDSNWHHLVCNYDGANVEAYLDGNLVGTSASITGDITYVNTVNLIGAFNTDPDNSFNGSIDDIMIFNRSLSINEVKGIYSKKIIVHDSTFGKNKFDFMVKPDDATDLETTLEDKCTSTGCVVFIPCGTYNLNSVISLKSKTEVIGSGECSIINVTGTTFKFSAETGEDYITLRDFTVEGNNRSSGTVFDGAGEGYVEHLTISGLHIKNVRQTILVTGNNLRFFNNWLENVSEGFELLDTGINGTVYQKTYIQDNLIESNKQDLTVTEYGEGIEVNFHSTGEAIITGNKIINFKEQGIDCNAEYCIIDSNIIIMDNTETRVTTGIFVNNEDVNAPSNAVISNNIIYNISGTYNNFNSTGIKIGTSAKNVIISGNILLGNNNSEGNGIKVDYAKSRVNIVGNLIQNLGRGIHFSVSALNTTLNGNNFFDNSQDINSTSIYNKIENVPQLFGGNQSSVISSQRGQIEVTNINGAPLIFIYPTLNPANSPVSGIIGFGEGSNSVTHRIYLDGLANEITFNGTTETGGKQLRIPRDSQGIIIGEGEGQENITLTSPNGSEYSCGVENGGTFICS